MVMGCLDDVSVIWKAGTSSCVASSMIAIERPQCGASAAGGKRDAGQVVCEGVVPGHHVVEIDLQHGEFRLTLAERIATAKPRHHGMCG